MEAKPEIKRIFPNCNECNEPFAQCCCKEIDNATRGLAEYMTLREQVAELELRENECKCGDFYTCDLCREVSGKDHKIRGLMDLWGDIWAEKLAAGEATVAPTTPPTRVEELEKALRKARDHFIGLSAYLATCATTTIIENLEATIAALHVQDREAARVLEGAGQTQPPIKECPECHCLTSAHHGPKIGCEGAGGNCPCELTQEQASAKG